MAAFMDGDELGSTPGGFCRSGLVDVAVGLMLERGSIGNSEVLGIVNRAGRRPAGL